MAAASDGSMGAAEWGMLILLSVLWGGSFVFNAIVVEALPVLTIVFCRVAIAALCLHLVMRVAGIPLPTDRRIWAAFLVMGLLNNALPFSLLVWGQTYIAAGVAAILNATTPLFTVVIAHALTADERLSPRRVVGVLAGLAGVVVMVGGTALLEHARGLWTAAGVFGHLACLGAAASYALAVIFGRRFARLGVKPLATATGQVTLSSVLLLPAMLYIDRPWMLSWPDSVVVGSLLALALLSTALAYILYFRILGTAGATNLSLVTFLVPVSAVMLGALLLNESLQPQHVAGMLLIAAGLIAIDGRVLAWRRRR